MGTIHQMFRDEAARRPEAVAVVAGERRMTYGELDAVSDRHAAALAGLGAGPGAVVPVALPRSIRLVAVLLGVLKAGAAATVLDVAWPRTRIAAIVGQVDADFVIAGEEIPGVPTVTELDGTGPVPPDRVGPDDPGLVFFTSGSTGKPKGALIPHAGMTGLIAEPRFAGFGPDAVMPSAAALPWDMAAMELWGMLATGGTCALIESEPVTSRQVRGLVAGHGATLMWLTSSLFNVFVEEDPGCFTGLRQLVTGGERLSPPHVGRFLRRHPGIELINSYGPAEVTCAVSAHRITLADVDREHGIPIGTPVPHTELFVVKDERDCADGEVGELWAAGPRVALRYVGDHPANATAFRQWRGRRVYRTGDLAYRSGGLLHFMGRADRQIKINGQRVEPAEVEHAAASVPGVRRAVALPMGRERITGLALFVSGSAPEPVAAHLTATLPGYLRPAAVRQVTEFPLTTNGKLDHRRLLAELDAPVAEVAEHEDPDQALVATELAAVLGRTGIPAGVPLAALGVGSLQLIRLGMRLERRTGNLIELPNLLRATNLAGLTDAVRMARPVAAAGESAGPVRLNPAQCAFLVRFLEEPANTSTLCPLIWSVSGEVNVVVLRAALVDVARRHEALRARYELTDPPTTTVGEPAVELATVPDVVAHLMRPLDPVAGPVWRAAFSGTELGVVVHHIAFDGWSEGVLARDLSHAYAARAARTAPVFARPAPSLRALAEERDRRDRYGYGPRHLARYRELLAGAADLRLRDETPCAPCAGPCPPGAHAVRARVPAAVLARWSALASGEGASLFSALLAAASRALAGQVRDPDIVIGIPVVMRSGPAEEDAVGCLINTVCVRPRLRSGGDRAAAIRATHAAVTEAVALRDVGFADLIRELEPPRTGRTPLYQVVFAVPDNAAVRLELPGCTTVFRRHDPPIPPTELQIEIRPELDGGAEVSVAYQCHRVPLAAARALARALVAELSELNGK